MTRLAKIFFSKSFIIVTLLLAANCEVRGQTSTGPDTNISLSQGLRSLQFSFNKSKVDWFNSHDIAKVSLVQDDNEQSMGAATVAENKDVVLFSLPTLTPAQLTTFHRGDAKLIVQITDPNTGELIERIEYPSHIID